MPNNRSRPPISGTCAHCGRATRLWPYQVRLGKGRYCGYSCRSKAQARPVAERFWAKTEAWRDCLLWTDAVSRRGSPRLRVEGRELQAARLAYELTYGPVPPGAHVRRRCRNALCVRPEHLVVAFDPAVPLAERFWARVQRGPGCWLWQGGHDERGSYGSVSAGGRRVRAHRLAWELTRGPIPRGLVVCHRCDTPGCVRPDHLFLGTLGDNNRDMFGKGRGLIPHRLGEANNRARLRAADIPIIRSRLAAGEPGRRLASEYGVTHNTIYAVKNGKTWKHVP